MRHRIFQSGILMFMLLGIFSMPMAFDFSSIDNQVVEFTQDNGLKFIVLPKHDVPIAPLTETLKPIKRNSSETPF